MKKIILVGSGGHSKSCVDVINLNKEYVIAGFVVENNNQKIKNEHDYPIIGEDNDLERLRKKYEYALVTVGQIKSAKTRYVLFNKLKKLNYNLPIIISPRSYVSKESKIKEGTIIMHDVLINSKVHIGKNCIINNKSLIEHDSLIGDHCHIATSAVVNGNVKVGFKSFIGSGSILNNSITVGNNCTIGSGQIIKKNIKSNSLIK